MATPPYFDEIAAIIRKSGRIPATVPIAPDSFFTEDLAIDSLDLVSALLKIQDQFDVVINDEDVHTLRRVGDLVSYVAARRKPAAA